MTIGNLVLDDLHMTLICILIVVFALFALIVTHLLDQLKASKRDYQDLCEDYDDRVESHKRWEKTYRETIDMQKIRITSLEVTVDLLKNNKNEEDSHTES